MTPSYGTRRIACDTPSYYLTYTNQPLCGARRPSSKARPERPANIIEAATWADAAAYLAGRLHVSPGEVSDTPGHEGRRPDMSPAAGAAMRAVLAEMGEERASEAVVDPKPLPWREAAQWQRLEASQSVELTVARAVLLLSDLHTVSRTTSCMLLTSTLTLLLMVGGASGERVADDDGGRRRGGGAPVLRPHRCRTQAHRKPREGTFPPHTHTPFVHPFCIPSCPLPASPSREDTSPLYIHLPHAWHPFP